jgi:hypothetical protein
MHYRKFSPLDRRYPVFELLDGEVVLLDVSRNDAGQVEVGFHEGAGGRVLSLEQLSRMLAEGASLAQRADDDASQD